MNRRTQVLVVGAGPAGMAAAVRASESGSGVTLLDDNATAGGQIWRGGEKAADTSDAAHWFASVHNPEIRVVPGATVVAADLPGRSLLIDSADGPNELTFQRLVIATGSRELFLPFPGWTLPGVTGAGGLQALVKSGLPVRGRRVVVAGSGPLLLAAAAYLRKRGAEVRTIAEQAKRSALAYFMLGVATQPGKLIQTIRLGAALAGISYRTNCWAEAAEGDGSVERVRLRSQSRVWTEPCEYAAVSWGLYPNTELAAVLGCVIDSHGIRVDELQQSTVNGVFCAGECTGIGGVDLALVEGEIAGYAAAGDPERARRLFPVRARHQRFAAALNAAFHLRPEVTRLARTETIVCRCEDIRFEQLEPFQSFRAAKLQTRCGMGPCQGRICASACAVLFGWKPGSVRQPIFPASVATLAAGKDTVLEQGGNAQI